MKYLIPKKTLKNSEFVLYEQMKYPIISEHVDCYYCRIVNKKIGIDKKLEGDLYLIVEEID